MAFARQRVSEMEHEFSDILGLCDVPGQRVEELAEALTVAGYAAVVVPAGSGVQLCQHNCPIAHVAEEFPQFCEAETEAFGRLLGTHVLRLATLAHGDGVCTTLIPGVRNDASPAVAAGATEGRSIP
jgi:predicted ArsR family transcriptional regulator